MQDACYNELSKYDLTHHESPSSSYQWLERSTGVRDVMGSIPIGASDFFLCPTLVTTEYSIFLRENLIEKSKKYYLEESGYGRKDY